MNKGIEGQKSVIAIPESNINLPNPDLSILKPREKIEAVLRKFKLFSTFLVIGPIYSLVALSIGVSLIPSVALMSFLFLKTTALGGWLRIPLLALGFSLSYFLFGFML